MKIAIGKRVQTKKYKNISNWLKRPSLIWLMSKFFILKNNISVVSLYTD